MKIIFDQVEEKTLPAFNGGEGALIANIFMDERNKILRGRLEKGSSIGMHCHETSSEIIFITAGAGKCVCDGVVERLSEGDCHYCPKGSTHSLVNDGEEALCFFAVVPQQ